MSYIKFKKTVIILEIGLLKKLLQIRLLKKNGHTLDLSLCDYIMDEHGKKIILYLI